MNDHCWESNPRPFDQSEWVWRLYQLGLPRSPHISDQSCTKLQTVDWFPNLPDKRADIERFEYLLGFRWWWRIRFRFGRRFFAAIEKEFVLANCQASPVIKIHKSSGRERAFYWDRKKGRSPRHFSLERVRSISGVNDAISLSTIHYPLSTMHTQLTLFTLPTSERSYTDWELDTGGPIMELQKWFWNAPSPSRSRIKLRSNSAIAPPQSIPL